MRPIAVRSSSPVAGVALRLLLLGCADAERSDDLGLSTNLREIALHNSTGKCEEWCKSDITTNGYEKHCGGDMDSMCGGCDYCKFRPEPEGALETGAFGVVSMNLMSWCTQGICGGKRMRNIGEAISKLKPAILGTQEHGDNNAPYDSVRNSLEGPSGMTHRGAGTYYDPSQVEPVGDISEVDIYLNQRKVSHQMYRLKGCTGDREIAYFNTHWHHSSHESQANNVINFMKEKAQGKPMILTGDFNVWGSKSSIDTIKKKLGLYQASAKGDTWCTGNYVDFILVSWELLRASGAKIDGDKCSTECPKSECDWRRSDHKLLFSAFKLASTSSEV